MTRDTTPATYLEILEQSRTLPLTLERLEGAGEPATLTGTDRRLIFTGCGTSLFLARFAAALTRALHGIPAEAVAASELWLLPELHLRSDSAVVAISRSGTTTEALRAIEQARGRGLPTAAVTLRAEAPLSALADRSLELPHVEERSIVMTQSFSNLLLALQWLVSGLDPGNEAASGYRSQLGEVVSSVRERLPQMDIEAAALAATDFGHAVFLGAGPLEAIAFEGMLKMKEMTQLPSEAYSTLEFRHGPISTVTASSLIVLLACAPTAPHDAALAAELHELGARVVIVGDAPAGTPADVVELASGLHPWHSGSLAIPFLQLLAFHRTIRLGKDPDRPRLLSAVVDLEETPAPPNS